jgi:CO/xanthine dehydrogenase Mo-binding subunit
MVRSRVAHGILRSIDADAARDMPGVRAMITVADLDAAGIKNMPAAAAKHRDGSPTPRPPQRPLAIDRVRYVGEPIAMVVAEASKEAKDAAEAVFAEIDQLPAVTTAAAAAASNAPLVHQEAPDNVCLDFHYGDTEKVAAAFSDAAHATRLSIRNNRIVVRAMEPRSAIGEYDYETDRLTLRLGCQGVFGQRNLVSGVLGISVEKLRVLTGNVGGSFGMKASAYPEYIRLLHAARTLGHPVKWTITPDVKHVFKAVPSAFPNGCHIAEVELDPDTGIVEFVSYATVNDFGVLVNPMLVAGQAHGGIAQGIGQAPCESVVYDEDGQLLTGSFMDYGLPRASDLPALGFESHPVPACTNPLGAKGRGEAGCAGSLPAVMNAAVRRRHALAADHARSGRRKSLAVAAGQLFEHGDLRAARSRQSGDRSQVRQLDHGSIRER